VTGRCVQEMAKTDPVRQGDDPYQNGGQRHAKHGKKPLKPGGQLTST
jgi:hypothetical protein